MRVRDLRRGIDADEQRLAELETALISPALKPRCGGGAEELAASERYAELVREQMRRVRDQVSRQQERLGRAVAELAGAGQLRLAVERLLVVRTEQAHRRARSGAQSDLDEHGRLRLMLEEE